MRIDTSWVCLVAALLASAVLPTAGCRRGGGSGDDCLCLADGRCCAPCGASDPDCAGEPDGDADADGDGDTVDQCADDGYCDPDCVFDPDCEPDCSSDGYCNPECSVDPDCEPDCGDDGYCNPDCAYDPDCEPDCSDDGYCNPDCAYDPDCEPDCGADGYCNPACDGDDPDCGPDCDSDGSCNPDCPVGTDPDCRCGDVDEDCCTSGEACVADALCVAVAAGDDRCLTECTPTACDFGSAAGFCIPYTSLTEGVCDAEGGSDPVTCTPDSTGCTTTYGTSTGTLCIEGSAGETFCFEECTVGSTGCDSVHLCVPLTGGGGACLPLG